MNVEQLHDAIAASTLAALDAQKAPAQEFETIPTVVCSGFDPANPNLENSGTKLLSDLAEHPDRKVHALIRSVKTGKGREQWNWNKMDNSVRRNRDVVDGVTVDTFKFGRTYDGEDSLTLKREVETLEDFCMLISLIVEV